MSASGQPAARSGSRPTGAGTRSVPEGYTALAPVDEVPPGWVATVEVDEHRLALANSRGEFYVLDDQCGHAGGPLGDNRLHDNCLLECPWHYAVFDVRTGEARSGPARKAQTTYPVQVVDGTVYVALG